MSAHASGPRVGTVSNRVFGFGGERNAYEARFITNNGFTTAEEACTHHRIRTCTRTRTCTRHAHMHTCTPDQMRVHRGIGKES